MNDYSLYQQKRADILSPSRPHKNRQTEVFFSLKKEGADVDKIPKGFEISENPDARVTLRRIQPKIITDEEVKIVDEAMKRFSGIEYYQIDTKKEIMTIYTGDQDLDPLEEMFGFIPRSKVKELLNRYVPYTAVLRFVLKDKQKREFIVERYCFLGSIEGWIEIGGPGKIDKLSKEYVRHLGEDSFYELF